MFEVSTGWKIGVQIAEAGGSYIVVPTAQLSAVCDLLTKHQVSHAVDGAVPRRSHNDSPFAMVVQLGHAVKAMQVQEILDLVP